MNSKVLIPLVILLILPSLVSATDYYVDNAASSGGNGLSWGTAWNSFSDIEWGASGVRAGDTLYISGGTYSETLNIEASGTLGNPITILTGARSPSPSGHDGLVTIDLDGGANYCIDGSDQGYVTVDGNDGNGNRNFYLTRPWRSGVYWMNSGEGVRLLYLHIYDTGLERHENTGNGIRTQHFRNGAEIAHCLVDTTWRYGIMLGGQFYYTGYGSGASIHHNRILETGEDATVLNEGNDYYNNVVGPQMNGGADYSDGMQIYGGYNRIYNNVFMFSNSHVIDGNHATIYFDLYTTHNTDHIQVFNNLLWVGGDSYAETRWRGIYLKQATVSSVDDVLIANNIMAGHGFSGIYLASGGDSNVQWTNVQIKNNIVYNCGTRSGNSNVIRIAAGVYDTSDVVIENNVVTGGPDGGHGFTWDGTTYSDVDAFNSATGFTNYDCEPDFVGDYVAGGLNNDFHLSSSDTCAIDRGITLTEFTTDLEGIARPQGAAWDIGAYELQGSSGCDNNEECNHLDILPCIDYVCSGNQCTPTYPSVPCDDGLYCNGDETCQSGSCVSSGNPCVDGDSYACTSLQCDEGADNCGSPIMDDTYCDDSVDCTIDSCVGAGGDVNGCTNTPNNNACLPLPGDCSSVTCSGTTGCEYFPVGCQSPPAGDAELWLPFNGGQIADMSGNNHPITVNGNPSPDSDKDGIANSALYFDGVDDYLNLGTGLFGIDQSGEFTISLWVNMENNLGSYNSLIKRSQYNNPFGVLIYSDNRVRNMARTISDDVYRVHSNALNPDVWYHVAVTYSDSRMVSYQNGQEIESIDNPGTLDTLETHDTTIGAVFDGTFIQQFNGIMDDIRIYNSALSQPEIQALYEGQQQQTYHRADNNPQDCVIDINELMAFMNRWKVSIADVGMVEMMDAIARWKLGNACT